MVTHEDVIKQSLIRREARPKPTPLMWPAGGKGWVKDKGVYTGPRGTKSDIER